jgi:exopolysaccharide biosynthesis protein
MATPGAPEAGREFVAMTPSVFLARHGLQAAINGGYFLPFKGGSAAGYDYYPYAGDPVFVSGASMHDGRLTSPVETDPADLENYDVRITTIFCVLRNRVIILGGQTCPRGAREAIAAGPRLLEGGMRASLPTRSTEPAAQSVPAGATPAQVARPRGGGPRTAVGVDKSGKRLFLVVVDGRQEGYSMGATSEQLQMLFESFGAHDAMSFDGGGSSTMVAAGHAGAPRLLSRPIHTGVPGRERPSANHLGVRANALAGKSK